VAGRRLGVWQRLAAVVCVPALKVVTRRTWSGREHIPRQGGVIIVANHMSHFDPLVVGHYIYGAGRWPSFLAKKSLFSVPVVGFVLKRARQIPVQRGTVDAVRALEAAIVAIKNGDSVIIYPEGTTTREPDLWPMRGKTGVARLWLETRAPVVPVVMWGPEKVFDSRTMKLHPRLRSPVEVSAGEPIDMSKFEDAPPGNQTLNEISEYVMLRLREMLVPLRERDPVNPWPHGVEPPPLWTGPIQRQPKETP
jgi:1-acyl-sn-glycerol-3-phosphate acyltransferase